MIMTMENAVISGPRFGSGVDAIVYSGLVIKEVEFFFAGNPNGIAKACHCLVLDCKVVAAVQIWRGPLD